MSAGEPWSISSSMSDSTTDATQGFQRAIARGVKARCTVRRSRWCSVPSMFSMLCGSSRMLGVTVIGGASGA